MKKAVITVVGKDSVGIIGKVCTFLAQKEINILDITQTIVDGFFNMMMIVDITGADNAFEQIVDELVEVGDACGVIARIQREEIFDKMHRI